jgi:hypothetical protein
MQINFFKIIQNPVNSNGEFSTSFQQSYYEKNIRNLILSPSTFLSNAPIMVIDTSKQNDSTTVSSVDVQLEHLRHLYHLQV